MSKLRINPRNKDNFGSRDEHKEITNQTNLPVASTEDINFYLNKSIHDFTEETLQKFKIACQQYNQSFIENTQKIQDKLFLLTKVEPKKKVETIPQENNATKDSLTVKLPSIFDELKSLIQEIVEDNTKENHDFLNILSNELVQINTKIQNKEPMIDSIYNQLTELLQKLQSFNIFQQKYIYRSIANCINRQYSNYHLISPEDGNFVDPKFHRIVSGNGQRITRGLSFILTDKQSGEVLKFGDIKTI
ncbi:hypothetical protein [Kordia sp.]|uniref:hypothetical protein n=1 Tax=Kordia sp. TaxID=1965332 RepID=UPI003B5930CA